MLLTAGDAEGKLHPKYFKQALRLRPTSKENPHESIQFVLFIKHGLGPNIYFSLLYCVSGSILPLQ